MRPLRMRDPLNEFNSVEDIGPQCIILLSFVAGKARETWVAALPVNY